MNTQFDTKQNKNNSQAVFNNRTQAFENNQPRQFSMGSEQIEFAPSIIHEVLSSSGQPLDAETLTIMEARFKHDFSHVQVHTGEKAANSAQAVQAKAYTVGDHVVFDTNLYAPHTAPGEQLLTHELAHVVQQGQAPLPSQLRIDAHDSCSERRAAQAVQAINMSLGSAAIAVQRQRREGSGVTVRSPVVEETVTQASDIAGGLAGRGLTQNERELARPIFGRSLDYGRVRLISSDTLSYRTVGNNIYVPDDFTIRNANMAQTLIHEMTHVWQYQHSGTSYISVSLGAQITAAIGRGSRNFAYAYTIQPDKTFFDFNPEQQGSIVEHYFAMLRDQREIPTHQAAGETRTYASNHLDRNGFERRLSATRRLAEITRELPQHERLIRQMRAALPRTEVDVLQLRTRDLMQTPGQNILAVPEERQLIPVRPLLEVRFPGL